MGCSVLSVEGLYHSLNSKIFLLKPFIASFTRCFLSVQTLSLKIMGTRSCQVLVVNVTERKGTFDGMESRLEEITKGNLWNYTHTKKRKKKD